MKVTKIDVKEVKDKGPLKGYVSLVLDDCLRIRDIRIIEGHEKMFLAFPSKSNFDGTFSDLVHPLNTEFRDEITEQVLDEYCKIVEGE